MAKNNKLKTLADKLAELMAYRKELEADLSSAKEEEDELRSVIVKGLLSQGLKYIRTETGVAFGVTNGRVTFKVKDGMEAEAIAWAQKEYPSLLSLSSAKVNQVVKPMLKAPAFFERVEGEPFLSVRKDEDTR